MKVAFPFFEGGRLCKCNKSDQKSSVGLKALFGDVWRVTFVGRQNELITKANIFKERGKIEVLWRRERFIAQQCSIYLTQGWWVSGLLCLIKVGLIIYAPPLLSSPATSH